jgi:hypothetical protein
MKKILFFTGAGCAMMVFMVVATLTNAQTEPSQMSAQEESSLFCIENGYEVNDNFCLFPDGYACALNTFYYGGCGAQYRNELECINPGERVTPARSCCRGLSQMTDYEIGEDGSCNVVHYDNPVCSACGNNICDPWENECNCRFDCQKSGDEELRDRVEGKILLQVREQGEAYYVDPGTGFRFYMGDGDSAYGVMYTLGLGILDENISKIPVGIMEDLSTLEDADGDGLDDKIEEALYIDQNDSDSDDDGYTDGEEVLNGFNPNGAHAMQYDQLLIERMKGRILLQVENRGQAWYVHPDDGKRYYLKDGQTAYQMMSRFGLGITNEDLFVIWPGRIYIPHHNKTQRVDAGDLYSVAMPLGWKLKEGPSNGFATVVNYHPRINVGISGYYDGDTRGNQLDIKISPRNLLDLGDYGRERILEHVENIELCSDGVGGTIMIDKQAFVTCLRADKKRFEAIKEINGLHYFIESFQAIEENIESIQKILSSIRFL